MFAACDLVLRNLLSRATDLQAASPCFNIEEVKLTRNPQNPILTPTDNKWENQLVFNPTAVYDQGQVHMIYRAMGEDGFSRFGYAKSSDGVHFDRNPDPVFEGTHSEFDDLGVEDPRMVKIDDIFYIIYTAVALDPDGIPNPKWPEKVVKKARVALATTKDFKTFESHGVIIPDLGAKNGSLFPIRMQGEYWLLYRSFKNETFFSHSINLLKTSEPHIVFRERPGFWDNVRTGIGSAPLSTDFGWLLFYHGVDEFNTYRLGLIILDKSNPTDILYRSPEPILEPLESYERFGFMPNVVFTCGAVEIDDTFYVYYGAGDMTVALATIKKSDVFDLVKLK
jgi:predicted GH43/DUF377 family glycosyl hydrolase